ncbi:MAG: hypothetical protein KDA61_04520 [Planctomycetales bacterium]|nr:hypothetical protein [Planctomycetales bacterium]
MKCLSGCPADDDRVHTCNLHHLGSARRWSLAHLNLAAVPVEGMNDMIVERLLNLRLRDVASNASVAGTLIAIAKRLLTWRTLATGLLVMMLAAPVWSDDRWDLSPLMNRNDHLSQSLLNWQLGEGALETMRGEVRLSLHPGRGTAFKPNWWKPGLDHPARMASDGLVAEGASPEIVLRLAGLAPGRHTLATYHNALGAESEPAIDVWFGNHCAASEIVPSHRTLDDARVAAAFVTFDAAAGEDVTIALRTHTGDAGSETRRLTLNGLELDAPNPLQRSSSPQPSHGDDHFSGDAPLRWRSPPGALKSRLYFGDDAQAIATADATSPHLAGEYDDSEAPLPETLSPHARYFWRVDLLHRTPNEGERWIRGDVWQFRKRRLAFPTAEGYGRYAVGGRGGRILKVTTLADGGPGSLRAAVEAEGPRTIIFDVSGRIQLKDRLIIRNPYLTIAGQTAPGNGICLSNFNLGALGTHDLVVRYLRVRPGDVEGRTLDGMGLASSDHAIFDHCSISWTQDEAFSSRGARNITLQRTLISEALNIADHKKYEKGKQHGYAASIGGDIGSFHHNLLAHCAGRNWSLAGGLNKAGRHTGRLDIRNNVVYNWSHRTTDGGAEEVNFVANYYKPGPAAKVFHALKPEPNPGFGPQRYFVEGNVMEGRYDASDPLAAVKLPTSVPVEELIVDQEFFPSYVAPQTANEAYSSVLADVGCNRPQLDEHDRRVIDEVRNGTTHFQGSRSGLPGLPDSQADVGGWDEYPETHRPDDWDVDDDGMPDAWERLHGLDPGDPSDAWGDKDENGYLNLEEYLNAP